MNRLAADSLAVKASVIKASVSIFDVLRKLGKDIEGNETQQMLCPNPDHVERRPSARVYADSNHVHCFGCGRTWDPIGVVKVVQRVPDEAAIEWLQLHFALPDLGSMAPTVIGTIVKQDRPDFAHLTAHTARLIRQGRATMGAASWHRAWLAFDTALVAHGKRQMSDEDFEEAMAQIGTFVQR